MKLINKYIIVPIVIMVLVSIPGLTTLPIVNADSSEDQSLKSGAINAIKQ